MGRGDCPAYLAVADDASCSILSSFFAEWLSDRESVDYGDVEGMAVDLIKSVGKPRTESVSHIEHLWLEAIGSWSKSRLRRSQNT